MIPRRRAIQLFLAVTSTAAVAVACGQSPRPTSQGGSGEGGEGGEGGEVSGEDPISYAAVLGLMKGHLLVARELMELKDYPAAEKHIGHPVEELYGDLEPALSQYGAPGFKQQLNTLLDLIQSAPTLPQTEAAFSAAEEGIDRALAALPQAKRSDPTFVVAVIRQLLESASSEYAASITEGRFAETIEYQDSRGFVRYADQLRQGIAPALQASDPALSRRLSGAMAALLPVWPTTMPPEQPIKTAQQVQALIQSI